MQGNLTVYSATGMYLIYTLLLLAGLVVSAPLYLWHFRRYAPTLPARLGRLKIPQLHGSIWVHAVSVGEVRAVAFLVQRLRKAYPARPIVLSTTTMAGHDLAKGTKDGADHVIYFPFDLPWCVRKALNRVKDRKSTRLNSSHT